MAHRFPALLAAPLAARGRAWLVRAGLFEEPLPGVAAHIRRPVREQIRAGADFIKVMTTGARAPRLTGPRMNGLERR